MTPMTVCYIWIMGMLLTATVIRMAFMFNPSLRWEDNDMAVMLAASICWPVVWLLFPFWYYLHYK